MAKSNKYFSNGMCQSFKISATNFRSKVIVEVADKELNLFWKVDKNNQICNCSRIGTVFDKVHGRPVTPAIGNLIVEAYIDMLNSEKEMEIVTNNNNEIVSAKLI